MLIGITLGFVAVTAVCVYFTERVDRPLRRADRLAKLAAADAH